MKLDWEKVRSERGPNLGILDVRFDWMRHPDGEPVLKRLILESVDWINIVALTPEGLSIMVDQYRFGIGARTLETPGGMVDPGEDPLTAAKRELLEETGYGGGAWTYLGAVEPNPAIHPHLCHHFLADGVGKLAEPEPGPGEAIGLEFLSLDGIRAAMADGSLRHALALSALARVFPLFDDMHHRR
ncbi:MAG: NUDIX hydrolase [Gammaproteobacteria bacterium]|nr:NUDIX hydrolase [Gammaproteobacteria bacterium]